MQNFVKKWKYLNLEPKMSYLSIFGLEFLKTIVLFEISNLEIIFNSYNEFWYRVRFF